MEPFSKVVNSFQPSTIFAKSSIVDVGQNSEYVSDLCANDFRDVRRSLDKSSKFARFCKDCFEKLPGVFAMTFTIYIQKIFPIIFQKQNLQYKSGFSKQLGNL